jgi:hypothetical protein
MKMNNFKDWIGPLAAAFVCFYISFFMMGDYYFHPNEHMYAFGGDALTIYYDFSYHICHGSGSTLSAMAYPSGEYIYLTDAEGAFANVFQWIHNNVIDICDYGVGIINGLNAWLLLVAAIIMYYLLIAFGVNSLLSVLFAGPIILLSPPFIRLGGHFGLAYPFLIPLAVLWFVRKRNINKFEKRDLLFLATLLFFTFNNPYTGFSTAFILMACGAISILIDRKFTYANIAVIVAPVFCLLFAFITFKLNDPYHDRIALQWGFFNYKANLEGFLATPGSAIDYLINKIFGKGFKVEFEASQNIGLATILAFVSMFIFKYFRKGVSVFTTEYKIFMGGAALIFLYASAVIFAPFNREWVEEVLGSLLMFKASARMAWSLYFALTIGGVIIIDKLTKEIEGQFYKRLVYLVFLCLWVFEIKYYMGPKFENKHYENHFSIQKNEEIDKIIKASNIEIDQYQAILALPKMMSWSDKFMGNDHWNTQYFAMRTSLVTGLPMISAMLSRLPVSVSKDRLEFIANPLIERSLQYSFPNKKDLLIVVGTPHPRKAGEEFLISISDTLFFNKDFGLMRLPIERINNNRYIQSARSIYQDTIATPNISVDLSFDNEASEVAHYGMGAHKIDKGERVVIDTTLNIDTTTSVIFSCWTHIDHKKYGIGNWDIIVNESNGKEISKTNISTRDSNDVQDDWIRSETEITVNPGERVVAIFKSNQDFIIDELLIRPVSQNVIRSDKSEWFLFNGYKVKK